MAVRAFSITADAVAAERKRVNDDLTRSTSLASPSRWTGSALRELGPETSSSASYTGAVPKRPIADHAALADTVNITQLAAVKIYPGNSALGEVLAVGREVKRFRPATSPSPTATASRTRTAIRCASGRTTSPESVGWYGEEAVVGDWQIIPAPLECGLNLWEIAALLLRVSDRVPPAGGAAQDIFRRQGVARASSPRLNVLGFGGGVSELS